MNAKTYPARGVSGSESWKWQAPQSPIIAVAPGDRVLLAWWGDSGVPQWCSGKWATVLKCSRRRVQVHPDNSVPDFVLNVLPSHHVINVRRAKDVK